jgi:Bacterial SH3 domain
MITSLKQILSLLLLGASSSLLFASAVSANSNTHFQQRVSKNTHCSFIMSDIPELNVVDVRKGPGTKFPTVTKLKRGDVVRASKREGNWVRIVAIVYGDQPNERFQRLEGWVINYNINGCSEDKYDMWRL